MVAPADAGATIGSPHECRAEAQRCSTHRRETLCPQYRSAWNCTMRQNARRLSTHQQRRWGGFAVHRPWIGTTQLFALVLGLAMLFAASASQGQSPCEKIKTACVNAWLCFRRRQHGQSPVTRLRQSYPARPIYQRRPTIESCSTPFNSRPSHTPAQGSFCSGWVEMTRRLGIG
jgi:hypothetical protein